MKGVKSSYVVVITPPHYAAIPSTEKSFSKPLCGGAVLWKEKWKEIFIDLNSTVKK